MTPRTPLVRERSRALALARAAALSALGLLLVAPTAGPRLERMQGAVEIGTGEPPVWRAAHEGDALAPGDAVRTGRDGRAELALPAGSVRLYGDSLLRIPLAAADASGADAVGLDAGSSLFDVHHRSGDTFEVRTPEVVVSIKGTRFLVVADARPEVAVFRGTVGLRRESDSDAAHEMLVREGFAAVAAPGGPFELVWSGAPDPWEAWLEGSGPPRSAAPAPKTAATDALDLEAKAAALAQSRRGAVDEATRRHPEVAERVKAIAREKAGAPGVRLDAPAAPEPDPLIDAPKDAGERLLEERYVESWLGTGFDLTTAGGAVVVDNGGQSWTLSETQLQSAVDGVTTLPQPLLDAAASRGGTPEQLAEHLLGLLH